ncbi:MAG: histone H1/H5 family protein [Treponema sp.]|nr:histone H1/H5 family protein [Treponema sp.]
MRRKNADNPAALNNRLNRAIERLLKVNREKGMVNQPSGQGADQAEAV